MGIRSRTVRKGSGAASGGPGRPAPAIAQAGKTAERDLENTASRTKAASPESRNHRRGTSPAVGGGA